MTHLPHLPGEQSGEGRAILHRLVIAGLFVRQQRFFHLLRDRRIDVMLLQIRIYCANYELPFRGTQFELPVTSWRCSTCPILSNR